MTAIAASGSTDTYQDFLRHFVDGFHRQVQGAGVLFTTDALEGEEDDTGLWDLFLDNLADRQHHNCHACRRFVEAYGGLVAVGYDGFARSVMWHGEVPDYYIDAFAALNKRVSGARITGVHVTSDKTWGVLQSPGTSWHHMAVRPPAHLVYTPSPLKTAHQRAAEYVEEYGMLQRGLLEFSPDTVKQALALLESEALYRNEKVIGPARWLAALHDKRENTKRRHRDNVTWLAVATAPTGFCHVKSTMVGTLLEDIAAGMSFEVIKARFAAKMNPLQYQRPQAAPTAGNIAQAEAVVAKLGVERSLRRRYARLDEVRATWKPTPPKAPAGGVFSHLKPEKHKKPLMGVKAPTTTWVKFARDVLPNADKIEYYTATSQRRFIGLVTAVNADAPPILQWDIPENRNPVSWYCWSSGSSPSQWSLQSNAWVNVTAITMLPSSWDGGNEHHGQGAILILEGARDTRQPSAALFPEMLKSELRAVRSTIEAFSRGASVEEPENASACGVDLRKGQTWDVRVRVTSGGLITEYTLDRWD
jgi:hypothetical protein